MAYRIFNIGPMLTALALAIALLVVTNTHVAYAATITVTTTDDELNVDGDCSLREAIQAANSDAAVDACTAGSGADVIELPAGAYTLTVTIANVATAVTLSGPLSTYEGDIRSY